MSIKSFLSKKISVKPLIMFLTAVLVTLVYPLTELLVFKEQDTISSMFLISLLSVGIVTTPVAFIILITSDKE
jgi:hypothetical protein